MHRRTVGLSLVFVIVLALAFSASGVAVAQDGPPPWVRLNIVHVEPQMIDEFIALQQQLTADAKENKVPWRIVSRTEAFGNSYRFMIATPMRQLAELDRPSQPNPSLVNRLRRCITERESYAVRDMPDLANPLPEDKEPGLMVFSLAKIAPGREQDYVDMMRSDVLPHFKDANYNYVSGSMAFGGVGAFIHVFYVDNYAELDLGSPVMRALGSDGAQEVTKKFSGVVTSNEQWIARVIKDASYTALPEESEEP